MIRDTIKSIFRRFKVECESGQTLVEYGLIIGLIAIAAIVGISLVASQVDSLWGGNASQIAAAIAEVLGL